MGWYAGIAAHWTWLVVGVALAIGEIVMPGVFLIWLGLAAILTGFATFLFGVPMAGQFMIFAAAAVAAVYAGRRWLRRNPIASADPLLNDRAARLVGQLVTVVEPIDRGEGRVRVGDGVWPARGPDALVGARMRVIRADGGVLVVEPA